MWYYGNGVSSDCAWSRKVTGDRRPEVMIPMESCINFERHHDNYTSGSRERLHCKLAPCIGYLLNDDAYLSSPSGLLLRTLSPQIEILYDKPKHQLDLYISAMMKTVDTPESGAIFIPWHKNVSAVSFSKSVVYSPVKLNAMHQVKLTISTDEKMANLDLESVLSIPSEGTKKITELLNRQQERLNQIENQIQPAVSSVKDWATETFTLPPWLKILIYAAFIVGILALCFIGLKSVKKSLATLRRPNCKADNNDQSDYVLISALYPPLPTLNYTQPGSHQKSHVPIRET